MAIYLESKTQTESQSAGLINFKIVSGSTVKSRFLSLKFFFKKGMWTCFSGICTQMDFYSSTIYFTNKTCGGKICKDCDRLWILSDLPSLVFRIFPRLLICFAASSERFPWTTEMLTPAFSKTCPSWSTQLMPPPPVYRNRKWERVRVDAISKRTLMWRCGVRSNFLPVFSKSSTLSVYL